MIKKVCGNCAHWMRDGGVASGLVEYRDEAGKLTVGRFFPCAVHAVEPDAGDAIALMGANGHCRCHADAFEPASWYLEELRELAAEQAAITATEHSLPGLELNRGFDGAGNW